MTDSTICEQWHRCCQDGSHSGSTGAVFGSGNFIGGWPFPLSYLNVLSSLINVELNWCLPSNVLWLSEQWFPPALYIPASGGAWSHLRQPPPSGSHLLPGSFAHGAFISSPDLFSSHYVHSYPNHPWDPGTLIYSPINEVVLVTFNRGKQEEKVKNMLFEERKKEKDGDSKYGDRVRDRRGTQVCCTHRSRHRLFNKVALIFFFVKSVPDKKSGFFYYYS